MQAWFGVGLIWLTLFSALRPRRLACLALCVTSLLPVGTYMLRNYVALERGIVTASLGRNLVYRVVYQMPDLTDPDAAPGDELERARQIVWRERTRVWVGPWVALSEELGWSDARINQAVVGFYLEQVRRHPGPFIRVTLESFRELATNPENMSAAFAFHNDKLDHCLWESPPAMPGPEEITPTIAFLNRLQPSCNRWWLLLAALSPLLAWGAGRRASFLALGGSVYFCLLAALVEVPTPRYRLPGVPLIYLAGCLSLAGIARWTQLGIRRLQGKPEPAEPAEGLRPAVEEAVLEGVSPGDRGEASVVEAESSEVASSDSGPPSEAPAGPRAVSAGAESLRQGRLRWTAVALAVVPALVGAAIGETWLWSFLLVLAAQISLAVSVTLHRAGTKPRSSLLNTGAWFVALVGTTLVTLLSSPVPHWVGTPTPRRRIVLVLLGLCAGVAVLYFLRPSQRGPEPLEPA